MREIGSEFWDVPATEKDSGVFPEYTQWYLSGRSALQAIIKDIRGNTSIAMPSWCCESMIKPFADAGFKVNFYPVYWENGLVQETSQQNSDVLFLMDYFGYSTLFSDVRKHQGITIRDVTHSIMSATYSDAHYYFGSLRKWCGIWTGGYAWKEDKSELEKGDPADNQYVFLRETAMHIKKKYIFHNINQATCIDKKEFLDAFGEAEKRLDNSGIIQAAERDICIAHKLDVNSIRRKRKENAIILMKELSDWLIFPEVNEKDCPMFVPVLVPEKKRDDLRAYLIRHEVYCPIHWPMSKYHQLDSKSRELYSNELSLVCDQRYKEDDMYRIVELINQFRKEM